MNLASRSLDVLRLIGRALACAVVLSTWGLTAAAAAGAVEPLHLRANEPVVDAWKALRVLADPEERLDATAAKAALSRFEPPQTPYANLGPRAGATWLHLPVQIEADASPIWSLRFHYALLHDVQVRVFDAFGQRVHLAQLGTLVPFADREQRTRGLSTLLQLPPGQRFDVLVRVKTPTATLVPIALLQQSALGEEESREQAFQGLMSGLWLFMILYSLVNWVQRRESLFLAYSGALISSWLFSQAVYGTGPQYLWPHSSWWAGNLPALVPMLMVMANVHFFVGALDMPSHAPRAARAMRVIGALAALGAVLFMLQVVPYRVASGSSMVLVIGHLAVVFPVILKRVRGGDRAAAYLLMGSTIYIAGVSLMIALLLGFLPVTFFTLHAAQFSFAAEMVCWLMVLGTRLEQLRQAAAAAQHEHEHLHHLAHTDALTGLRNRRGLLEWLQGASADGRRSAPGQRLAVFMLDLDGFKLVNDRWGHDTGDELLRQAAQRLTRAVRPTDVVARLGGDEFVVAVFGLGDDERADAIGQKLLAQFQQPFSLADDRTAAVGATIGFAMAGLPLDDPADLLQRADAAMYRGKQSGRNTLVAAPA
ncbi:diguanylate cyclase [Ideonella sp. A 288]|uniref:diguanylate cyclase n=1 Tax=Ideonella sp. A 288 TaxID=1962181 RepID=UPI001303F3F5|nr:diguanylate cyclase [Ideonella sp. A 288]